MTTDDATDGQDRQPARAVADLAANRADCAWERKPVRAALRWAARVRRAAEAARVAFGDPGAPWQDVPSWERRGWRTRLARIDGGIVFAVDYQTCYRCAYGWVEMPWTIQRYQRCGIASAALAALRAEHPAVISWHTLGGHFTDSEPFWSAAGATVLGGYQKREICRHRTRG